MPRHMWLAAAALALAALTGACTSAPGASGTAVGNGAVPAPDALRPCDQAVSDPQVYVDQVLAHPAIAQLNQEFTLQKAAGAGCWVKGQVEVYLHYELPTGYSRYGIAYRDMLRARVNALGGLELQDLAVNAPLPLERDAIVAFVRSKIDDLETRPRVQEFMAHAGSKAPAWTNLNTRIVRISAGYGWIEPVLFEERVRGYSLDNAVEWTAFPEVAQAHAIIERDLFAGDMSACTIRRDDFSRFTIAEFHDFDPWHLRVAIECAGKWGTAWLTVLPDGTYQRLSVEWNR